MVHLNSSKPVYYTTGVDGDVTNILVYITSWGLGEKGEYLHPYQARLGRYRT